MPVALDALADLLTMDRDVGRRVNANLHTAAIHMNDCHHNVVVNDDRLIPLARQDEHGRVPSYE